MPRCDSVSATMEGERLERAGAFPASLRCGRHAARHTRRAIVTGGASGMGEATARRLAEAGATVVILDRDAGKGEQVAVGARRPLRPSRRDERGRRRAPRSPPRPRSRPCARASTARASDGRSGRSTATAVPHSLDTFRKVIEINLIGTFNVLRLAASGMSANEPDDQGERGVIVNTASIAAFDGQIGQAAYSASKGGVVALTLTAARDLAAVGIRVCTIAPGLIDTPLLGGLPQSPARRACPVGAVPEAPRRARRLRLARDGDRAQQLPERRGDPHGRGHPDAAEVGQPPCRDHPHPRRHRSARRQRSTSTTRTRSTRGCASTRPCTSTSHNGVWGIASYAARARDREGPHDVLERGRDPARHRPDPDDDRHGRPRALEAPQARQQGLHAAARARQRAEDPRRSATRSSTRCANGASATSSTTSPRRCR